MKIGYARVSRGDKQSTDMQEQALNAAGCERIFTDTMTGRRMDRPGLQELFAHIRAGDEVIVYRFDRFARSLSDLVILLERLALKKASFRSLTEKFDTSGATGRLLLHIVGALAEFERSLIAERTADGLAAARARGVKVGRPPKLSAMQRENILREVSDGHLTQADAARIYKVSPSTITRLIQETNVSEVENQKIMQQGQGGGKRPNLSGRKKAMRPS